MSACAMEDIVSCKGRMRIIAILIKAKELNITEIARRAALNHSTVISHLKALESVGLVNEKTFGRIRIFSFNFQDDGARIFVELFNRFSLKDGTGSTSGGAGDGEDPRVKAHVWRLHSEGAPGRNRMG